MNYNPQIEKVYEHIENDCVDKAVIGCLRIARHLKDYFYTAVFLRELYPNIKEFLRVFSNDADHLNNDAMKFLSERSLDIWLEAHTLDFNLHTDENGQERNVLNITIGEMESELYHWDKEIEDLVIPQGMSPYDTAYFYNKNNNRKSEIRLRVLAINTIRERVKARCLNYVIGVEKQLYSQKKSQSFLEQVQNEVNNYFKGHSEEVYNNLQKASQLVESNDLEDFSNLLLQVRRAIKASADYFYPPSETKIMCSDGKERLLGDDQYLNRFNEFILSVVAKSLFRDCLNSEYKHLAELIRRLNNVASKGVHTNVSMSEAKQGFVSLYFVLYNICSYLQGKSSNSTNATNNLLTPGDNRR